MYRVMGSLGWGYSFLWLQPWNLAEISKSLLRFVLTLLSPCRYLLLFPSPGKLFVVGGFDGSHALRCVEVYDPARNEWRMLGSMTVARSNAGVAVLGDFICAMGGFDGNNFLNTLEVYDPETDEWSDCADALSSSA